MKYTNTTHHWSLDKELRPVDSPHQRGGRKAKGKPKIKFVKAPPKISHSPNSTRTQASNVWLEAFNAIKARPGVWARIALEPNIKRARTRWVHLHGLMKSHKIRNQFDMVTRTNEVYARYLPVGERKR